MGSKDTTIAIFHILTIKTALWEKAKNKAVDFYTNTLLYRLREILRSEAFM